MPRWGRVWIIASAEPTGQYDQRGIAIMRVPSNEMTIMECPTIGGGCGYTQGGDIVGGMFVPDEGVATAGELLEAIMAQNEDDQKNTKPRHEPGE